MIPLKFRHVPYTYPYRLLRRNKMHGHISVESVMTSGIQFVSLEIGMHMLHKNILRLSFPIKQNQTGKFQN